MTWLDITVQDYTELYEDIFSGDIYRIVSSIHGISQVELEELPFEDALQLERECYFITQPIPTTTKDFIEIDGTILYLIPFNQLEFGAFIDMERALKDPLEHLPQMIGTLYRQKTDRGELLTPLYEPYDNFTPRYNHFRRLLIVDVWGTVHRYIKWRDNLLQSNSGLFEEAEDLDNIEGDLTPDDKKEIERQKRAQKWGYELLIMKLANNDPTKIDIVLEFPVVKAFNLLAMMQEMS